MCSSVCGRAWIHVQRCRLRMVRAGPAAKTLRKGTSAPLGSVSRPRGDARHLSLGHAVRAVDIEINANHVKT
jgi:hypothetical protein